MKKIFRRTALTLIITVLSCTMSAAAGDKKQAQQFDKVAAGNNEFAFDIYRKLADPEKNLLISPLSIFTAFSMVYAGSHGGTKQEIERVFRFKVTGDELYRSWGGMLVDMKRRARSGKYQLTTANRIWIGSNFRLEDPFTQAMKKYYESGLKQLDFAGDPEGSRSTINKWVAKKTNNRITGLVPDGAVTQATSLVLTNAVYFLGTWEHPFNIKSTEKGDFHITPAKKITVPMMKTFSRFKYAENDDHQIVSLPYKTEGNKNQTLSMIILLPKGRAGLEGLEKKLTVENWKAWIAALRRREVYVYLPRFEVTYFAGLADALTQMGMKTAFSPDADFSGIAPKLGISEAFHKAYVSVNEKGTEAAAATAVIMVKANGGTKNTFRADHPFLFAIYDNRTGAIIFIGRVTDPSL